MHHRVILVFLLLLECVANDTGILIYDTLYVLLETSFDSLL